MNIAWFDEIPLGGKARTLVPVGDALKNPEAAQSRANIAKQFFNRFKSGIAYESYRKLF